MCRARALPPRTVESVAAAADGDGDLKLCPCRHGNLLNMLALI